MASRTVLHASTLANVAMRWLKMADDARRMAGRTRDLDGKRIMLEIARRYDDLAAWAEKIDAIPEHKPD